jgi:hypothetical protein
LAKELRLSSGDFPFAFNMPMSVIAISASLVETDPFATFSSSSAMADSVLLVENLIFVTLFALLHTPVLAKFLNIAHALKIVGLMMFGFFMCVLCGLCDIIIHHHEHKEEQTPPAIHNRSHVEFAYRFETDLPCNRHG